MRFSSVILTFFLLIFYTYKYKNTKFFTFEILFMFFVSYLAIALSSFFLSSNLECFFDFFLYLSSTQS